MAAGVCSCKDAMGVGGGGGSNTPHLHHSRWPCCNRSARSSTRTCGGQKEKAWLSHEWEFVMSHQCQARALSGDMQKLLPGFIPRTANLMRGVATGDRES